MSTITLRATRLMARLDPRHGGEVIDLIDLDSGRQLLGRPPFESAAPVAGDLDEETWTRAYRGGWQMLAPNAGNACVVGGVSHGFHGRASNDPWRIISCGADAAELAWAGHGLLVHRRYTIDDEALTVEVRLEATRDRTPAIAVEHVALGTDLLRPTASIEIPPCRAVFELDAEGKAPRELPQVAWPHARMIDGSDQRVDRWSSHEPCSRMLAAAYLAEGRVMVWNAGLDAGVTIRWEHHWLKHLWVWHEVRATGGPWRNEAEMLVIEPASVPHHAGLSHAIERGEARWLNAGERERYSIRVGPSRIPAATAAMCGSASAPDGDPLQ